MLFFMVQVAVQSVKIEVIDEQEDDQRSGHAAGHYRKVVDVVDRQRHDEHMRRTQGRSDPDRVTEDDEKVSPGTCSSK